MAATAQFQQQLQPYWILLVVLTYAGVTSGLYFTEEPSDQVAVLSKPLSWPCSATDQSDQVVYSWTLNQQSLPTSANQVIYSNGTLHVRRLTADDVGVYTCTATSDGETITSREATLELAYINLSFGTSPASQTTFLEDTVHLTCQITSLPAAIVTWTLDGNNVTRGTVTTSAAGESILTLSHALYKDAGVYKCLATNQMLGIYRYSLEATLVIQGRPVFQDYLRSVSVPLGFTATFTCRFHGNPQPVVRWLLHKAQEDGSVSAADIQNTPNKYKYYQNGTFHIFAVTYDDEGFYTCNVDNMFGEMSESAQLTVTGAATIPEMTLQPANTSVPVGGSVMFNCWCDGNPDPNLAWQKNGYEIITSDTVTLHNNGSLSLLEIQSTDAGWFSCFCENAVGVVNQSAFLDVQVAPSLSVNPQYSTVLEGDLVMLHCHTEGNPAPNISWLTPYLVTISPTQAASGYTVYQNGSLQIKTVALEDAGIYSCRAINSIGAVNQSATVRVEAPPEFSTLPVSQSVNVGHKAFLHCRAKGLPRPSYTWSKDGEGLIRSTATRQIYMNNTLALHHVGRQDAGVYRCSAANVRGQVSTVATLSVLEPPSFSVPPVSQKVKVGATVTLRCLAVGYPVPTQRWVKDGRQLVIADNIVSSPDNSQLTIVGIQESQFGRYDCLATNMAGSVSITAWIETEDMPVFTVTPQNTTVNQSETLILPCQGQADEAPSVQWYRGTGGEATLVQDSDRVTVTRAGDLSFGSMLGTDEGWYTCTLYNSVGQISTEVYINVLVPPHIFFTNSPQSTLGLFSVTLTCLSSGDPAPTLQWYNPLGVAIQPSPAYLMSGDTLEIGVANGSTDAGDWTCKACNFLGCDSETLQVIIEGVPIIESFTGSKQGGIVTLTCDLSGEPTPSVTFTSQGQLVTMATRGHSTTRNALKIVEAFLRPPYSCQVTNTHGKLTKLLAVPEQTAPPTVTHIESGWVTLRWSAPPVTLGSLPLTGYTVQKSADSGTIWQNAATETPDLLTSTYLNISGLEPYAEYSFRVATNNILGRGMFSEPSSTVKTLAGAPGPPTNVITLNTNDGVYLLVWNPPISLNGPEEDLVYQYKLSKTRYSSGKGDHSEEIHSQGTLLYNQSREIEIKVTSNPGHYLVALSAVNTRLNISSETVTIPIDFSVPAGTHKQTGGSGTRPDRIIAIVFGVVGGVVAVCLLIFLVKHVRTQRKSESMSLVNPRLPLDQFYMENPKDLYRTDSRLSIKRRSGHSFYSFQEEDSFHGNSFHGSRSMLNIGSSPRKRAKPENEVLLVSKNPLFREPELMSLPVISSLENTPEHKVTVPQPVEESCAQTEISAPVSEVTSQPSHKSSATGSDVITSQPSHKSPATGSDVITSLPSHKSSPTGSDVMTSENDKNSNTTKAEPITPLSAKDLEEDIMKIYSSMSNEDSHSLTSSHQPEQAQEHIYSSIHSEGQSSRSKASSASQRSNYSNGPDDNFIIQKPPVKTVPANIKTVKNGGISHNSGTSSPISVHKSNASSKSGNHKQGQNGKIQTSTPKQKPPIRVLSLDGLRPESPCKFSSNIDGTSPISEDNVSAPLVNGRSSLARLEYDSEVSDDLSSDTDSLIAMTAEDSLECVRPLDVRIEDNLLTDEEYHRDVVVADLY